MIVFRLAYRFANGHLEGFAGCGFSREAAERDARRKAASKCDAFPGEAFEASRVVVSRSGLTRAEFETVRADWAVSERSSVV